MAQTVIPFNVDELICNKFEIYGELSPGDTDVRTGFTFGVHIPSHHVRCRIVYQYLQNEKLLLELDFTTSFDVQEEAMQSMVRGDKFVIEPYFAQYLATINVGAARGEIHARSEMAKSSFVDAILPPINLMEAIPDDIEIEIDNVQ